MVPDFDAHLREVAMLDGGLGVLKIVRGGQSRSHTLG